MFDEVVTVVSVIRLMDKSKHDKHMPVMFEDAVR